MVSPALIESSWSCCFFRFRQWLVRESSMRVVRDHAIEGDIFPMHGAPVRILQAFRDCYSSSIPAPLLTGIPFTFSGDPGGEDGAAPVILALHSTCNPRVATLGVVPEDLALHLLGNALPAEEGVNGVREPGLAVRIVA